MGKKLILSLIAIVATASVVFAATMTFSDVPTDHWGYNAVEWNNAEGIMTGPGDAPGTFDPNGAVNRVQLATTNQRMYQALNSKIEALEARVAALEPEEMMTIAELVVATEDLSTLLAALEAAELVSVFEDEMGDYTVFAPTNEAFADIQSTVDTLLLPENQADLQDVLKFHVVDGAAMAGDLSDGMELTTLNGDTLTVEIDGDNVYVGGAMVTTADVEASNGVVHIIDTVLVP